MLNVKNGFRPILCFCDCVSIDAVLNFDDDVNANANVKCEQTLRTHLHTFTPGREKGKFDDIFVQFQQRSCEKYRSHHISLISQFFRRCKASLRQSETRMHSSRMRTARSSGRRGGFHQAHPPRADTPPGSRHTPREQTPLWSRLPLEQIPPRSDIPPVAYTPPGTRYPPC